MLLYNTCEISSMIMHIKQCHYLSFVLTAVFGKFEFTFLGIHSFWRSCLLTWNRTQNISTQTLYTEPRLLTTGTHFLKALSEYWPWNVSFINLSVFVILLFEKEKIHSYTDMFLYSPIWLGDDILTSTHIYTGSLQHNQHTMHQQHGTSGIGIIKQGLEENDRLKNSKHIYV